MLLNTYRLMSLNVVAASAEVIYPSDAPNQFQFRGTFTTPATIPPRGLYPASDPLSTVHIVATDITDPANPITRDVCTLRASFAPDTVVPWASPMYARPASGLPSVFSVQVGAEDFFGQVKVWLRVRDDVTVSPSGQGATVQVSSHTTLQPVSQNVEADATSGPFTIVLPAFADWLGQDISITKVDAGANAVTWQTNSPTDVVVGLGTTGTLTEQGAVILIRAVQA